MKKMMAGKSVLTLAFIIPTILGHGRLIEPPSRSSMWRYGFNTPKNYNDNELFCGGFNTQWNVNGGNCGVCGDSASGIRDNEAGGRYATGVISRCYPAGTSFIQVKVEITANHKGYFEFRLCEHNDTATPITHSCLNQHILKEAQTENTQIYIDQAVNIKQYTLGLPPGLRCTQCVLQWRYHTGNNWGCDGSDCCVGCGPRQEEFYGCSDVAILPDCQGFRTAPTPRPTTTLASIPTPKPSSTASVPIQTDYRTRVPVPPSTSHVHPSGETTRTTTPSTTTQTTPPSTTNAWTCRAVGPWMGSITMDKWCVDNCNHNPRYCPASHCTCQPAPVTANILRCQAVGIYAGMSGMDKWCVNNCNHDPPNCPASHCACQL